MPPQFDALGPGADLVTLTIGGNDAEFMTSIGTCALTEERAAAADAMAVDPYEASTGHDACKGANVRWTEPTLGGTAPAHPNAAGMAAMAELIEAELNR
ncbi:hypothetical protein BJF79_05785 [Actinomadura sp. CNU-125]|uniref:hypothetical protein n=1 Tax=Actinomadura sp. CNU-125 TaxID=1904961 RepID=UPI00095E37E4|nr:hypothetical protein [Actinomadura sp. CNU-125]OLT37721.1 hypothetical protein BJF79_05785 [Actinomadura sp. CNU-125]